MDYSKLKSDIEEITEIAQGVPEAFREKCFELLLSNLLAGHDLPPEKWSRPKVRI